MRVTDNQGATFTQTRTVLVHAENRPPSILVSHNRGRVDHPLRLAPGEPVQLFFGASALDDPVASWVWDIDDDGEFDDGSESPKTVSYPTAGTYRVHLRATDVGGLSSTASLRVEVRATVNRAPTVSFNLPPTPRPGTPVSLFASGADADGDTLSYAWDADGDGAFDDGNAQFLQYSYAQAGTYDVSVGSPTAAAGSASRCRRWS